MPLLKFKSLQDAEAALWREPGDPALWRSMRSVWAFAARTCPRRFPRGVYRHRSIEAAQAQRDEWEGHDFDRFWARQRQAAGK